MNKLGNVCFFKQFVVFRGHLKIPKVDVDAFDALKGLINDRKYINKLFDIVFSETWLKTAENISKLGLLIEIEKSKEYLTMKGKI